MKIVRNLRRAGAVVVGAGLPVLANAQPVAVDVSDVVSAIEGAAAPIAAIGAAVLILLVGIQVYKWARRAM